MPGKACTKPAGRISLSSLGSLPGKGRVPSKFIGQTTRLTPCFNVVTKVRTTLPFESLTSTRAFAEGSFAFSDLESPSSFLAAFAWRSLMLRALSWSASGCSKKSPDAMIFNTTPYASLSPAKAPLPQKRVLGALFDVYC